MKVIAKTSKTVIVATVVLLLPTFFGALLSPSPLSIAWVVIGLVILRRIAHIKVAVSSQYITVLNFFRTTHIPIWEAEIEVGDPEGGLLLSDSGGKYDKGGRSLYIMRRCHDAERVHIGVAPRYGSEVDRIHDELISEIKKKRIAYPSTSHYIDGRA